MEIEKREIKRHLFICTNLRDNSKDSCSTKDSALIVKELKTKLRNNELWSKIKVSKSGCLGPCSKGISATLYPDNLLITQITLDDVETLYAMLTR